MTENGAAEAGERAGVAAPSRPVSDTIWLAVVLGFVAVMVGGFAVLAAGVFVPGEPGLVDAARVEQMAQGAALFLSGVLAGVTVPALRR